MQTRRLLLSLFLFLCGLLAAGQTVRRSYDDNALSGDYLNELKREYGQYKSYPVQFERAILIALAHYPELKAVPISFVTRPHHSLGFTRVTWLSLVERPATRHFLIVISDSTEPMLMPLLFKRLSFNAQIGAIGHELGHVADFLQKTTWGIVRHAASNISARYIDRFEFHTDAICIAHGLGYQLLDWSIYVRRVMHTVNWLGPDYAHRPKKRERYMNPPTIVAHMQRLALYQN